MYIHLRLIVVLIMTILLTNGCTDNPTEEYEGTTINVLNPIFADGQSMSEVDIDYGKNLPSTQQVQLSTEAGTLRKLGTHPDSTFTSTLTLTPNANRSKVILSSNSLEPAENVRVCATIIDFTTCTFVSFEAARPEDFMLSSDSVLISEGTHPIISGELYRATGTTSNGLREDISSNIIRNDTLDKELLLKIPEYVFTSDGQFDFDVDIIQHVSNAEIEVTCTIMGSNSIDITKEIVLYLR